ncbi:hypothetical protein LTR09_004379 [Extremus antarcticus]|uniref:Uncharacterized protein n=1 Tax=Extremus antarcticus TaxID=702011 RepID=A0AAJ0DQ23_9PEZI|nr:hypothetical protein LTR09_004379 [Extremus antarcticus]
MSAASFDAIKKRYGLKQVSISTWRDPSLSVHPARGGRQTPFVSPEDAAKPFIPQYRVRYDDLPQPTDDEDSGDDGKVESKGSDYAATLPHAEDHEADDGKDVTETADTEPEAPADYPPPAEPTQQIEESATADAPITVVSDETLESVPSATDEQSDPAAVLDPEDVVQPSIAEVSDDLPTESNPEISLDTMEAPSDIITSDPEPAPPTTGQDDPASEVVIIMDEQSPGDERRVSFAPGTPETAPRKKKSAKGTRSKKKKIAVAIDSLPDDVLAMLGDDPAMMPPPPPPPSEPEVVVVEPEPPIAVIEVEKQPAVTDDIGGLAVPGSFFDVDDAADPPAELQAQDNEHHISERATDLPESSAEVSIETTTAGKDDNNDTEKSDTDGPAEAVVVETPTEAPVAESLPGIPPPPPADVVILEEPQKDGGKPKSKKKKSKSKTKESVPPPIDLGIVVPAGFPSLDDLMKDLGPPPELIEDVGAPVQLDIPDVSIDDIPDETPAPPDETTADLQPAAAEADETESSEPPIVDILDVATPDLEQSKDDLAAIEEVTLDSGKVPEDASAPTETADESANAAPETTDDAVDTATLDDGVSAEDGSTSSEEATSPIDSVVELEGSDKDETEADESNATTDDPTPSPEVNETESTGAGDAKEEEIEVPEVTDKEADLDDQAAPSDTVEPPAEDAVAIEAVAGEAVAGEAVAGEAVAEIVVIEDAAPVTEEEPVLAPPSDDLLPEPPKDEPVTGEVPTAPVDGADIAAPPTDSAEPTPESAPADSTPGEEVPAAEAEPQPAAEAAEPETAPDDGLPSEPPPADVVNAEADNVETKEVAIEEPAPEAPPSPNLSKTSSGGSSKRKAAHWERPHSKRSLDHVFEDTKVLEKPHTSGKRSSKEETRIRDRRSRYSTTEEDEERRRRKKARKAEEAARAAEDDRRRRQEEKERRIRRHQRDAEKLEERARQLRAMAEADAKRESESKRRRHRDRDRDEERTRSKRESKVPALAKGPGLANAESVHASPLLRGSPKEQPAAADASREVPVEAPTEARKEESDGRPPSSSGSKSHRRHRHHSSRSDGDRPARSRRESDSRPLRPVLEERTPSFFQKLFKRS